MDNAKKTKILDKFPRHRQALKAANATPLYIKISNLEVYLTDCFLNDSVDIAIARISLIFFLH